MYTFDTLFVMLARWCALACVAATTALAFLAATTVLAQGPDLGEPIAPTELAGLDLVILPDGSNLPSGRGSVTAGATLYARMCLACHAEGGEGGLSDRLAGGHGSLATGAPVRTLGSYWPEAITIFDYVRRAMPYTAPGSLSDDEVYALTAYLLHLNDIVAADAQLDARGLAAIRMPNRNGFVWVVE